ncbi:dipeptidase [Pseudonocardia acaciae]|uniref:dipeptidase n=1 Tax=Pseudonocardia acaciae TaxID=551276 RepID=UPI0007E8D294|nr:membrane dipeptidase [Pseudonocardia acaciae]
MIADCHNDLLLHVLYQHERGRYDPFGDVWLPRLKAGGVVCQVLPVCTQEQFVGEAALRRCLLLVEQAYRCAQLHPADVAVVHTAGELDAALAGGRIALLLALEGTEPVGNDLAVLDALFRAGIRMASLTWNRRTMLADGVGEQDAGGRLTRLGVEAVAEMERLGMIVDVSHLSEPGFWHLHEIATRPYLASHSSCRALRDHPRNLTDAQLTALAGRGGLVGINAFGPFLADSPSVHDYLDHAAHAVELLGADRVALGPDFFQDIFEDTNPIATGLLTAPGQRIGVPGLSGPEDLAALPALLAERLGPDAARLVASESLLGLLRRALPCTVPNQGSPGGVMHSVAGPSDS